MSRRTNQSVCPRVARRSLALLSLSVALLGGGGCRAQEPWPLWQHYTEKMVDDQGRVIDHTAGDHTTSEGESYALFFALVANDRPRFEKLLSWTESNLAGGDLTERLPAWSWGKAPDGGWRVLDPNPASDADLWIAYDLLEAGRLWHEARFEQLGRTLLLRIAQQEVAYVPGLGVTLLPSSTGFHPDPQTWYLNPSYLPPPVLRGLASAQPDGPWSSVASSLLPMLQGGSGAGFAMDWVVVNPGIHPSAKPTQPATSPAPAGLPGNTQPAPVPPSSAAAPLGSYDAIRVYLWLGLADEGTPGRRDLLAAVPAMATYLKSNVIPPEAVNAAGVVVSRDAPPGFSAAVIPYLEALGLRKEASVQSNRLGATRDPATGLYGKQQAYYDQNLALFATGWGEGRFRFDRDGHLLVRWK